MDFRGRWKTDNGMSVAVTRQEAMTTTMWWFGHVIGEENIPTYWDEEGKSENPGFNLKDRVRDFPASLLPASDLVPDRKRIAPPRISRD